MFHVIPDRTVLRLDEGRVIPDNTGRDLPGLCLFNRKLAVAGRHPQYAPPPVTLTFDLLISKLVSESSVSWATSVPIFVFLGLTVLELFPMYATDRRQTKASLNAPA